MSNCVGLPTNFDISSLLTNVNFTGFTTFPTFAEGLDCCVILVTLFNKLAKEMLGDERGVLGPVARGFASGRVATVVEDCTVVEVVGADDENKQCGLSLLLINCLVS